MNVVFFSILIVEVSILIYTDKKIWGTYFSPISFLSIPYIVVLFFSLLFGPSLGFFKIYWPSILIWIIGLFVFWLPGFVIAMGVIKKTGKIQSPFSNITIKMANLSLIKLIVFISLVIVYYKIFKIVTVYKLGTADYQKYFGRGFPAHLTILLRFVVVYFIIIVNKKEKLLWAFIILILLTFVFSGSKSWIFVPIAAGLLIRYYILKDKMSISIKSTSIVLLTAFLVFFAVYYFTVGAHLTIKQYALFLIRHISIYLFSGVISLSEYIKHGSETGVDPSFVFRTPINIFNFLTGSEIQNITSNIWISINQSENTVNVKTLFGTIYIYSGIFWGIISTLYFGFLYYLVLLISVIKKDIIILVTYTILASMLLFGWFGTYVQNIAFYELPISGIIFYIIEKFRISKEYSNPS